MIFRPCVMFWHRWRLTLQQLNKRLPGSCPTGIRRNMRKTIKSESIAQIDGTYVGASLNEANTHKDETLRRRTIFIKKCLLFNVIFVPATAFCICIGEK